MKNALLIILLSTVLLLSCSKSDSARTGEATVQGTWTLAETLADPGDGSGRWQPAVNYLTLTFTADGAIRGNAFPEARHYEVLNDTTIKFVYADETFIIYNYTLSQSMLTLSGGGCIEACGLKFTKGNTPL